ncbi:MAG: hypothetical protein J6A01_12280, partial [Proteobacteria bacterium]|nr:hypothetical protein [Pseudomonadota bacterium]
MRKSDSHFLAICIMLLCANACDESESNNPQSSMNCQITQADCDLLGKTLDAERCICIDSGSLQGNCTLTEAMCAAENKRLDAVNCICTDSGSSQVNCPLTEALCASANKKLDVQNCICIDSGAPQNCQ